MRILVGLIAAGLVAGCASAPATVGMTVADYSATCTGFSATYQTVGGVTVAECPNKPDEYAIIDAGQVTAIYDAPGFVAAMQDRWCADNQTCRGEVSTAVYRAYEQKVAMQKQLRRDMVAAFTAPGPAGQPQPVQPVIIEPPRGIQCSTQTFGTITQTNCIEN